MSRPAFFRPTWAEVDLKALAANLDCIRARVRPAKVLFVVKGNAYGHGLAAVGRAAQSSGKVFALGVSSVEEGIAAREAGIRLPILVLGSLFPFESFEAAIEHRLTPTVASLEGARRLKKAARKARSVRPAACHLKIDTGMGRIGVRWPAALEVARSILVEPGVKLEGVYTHFACSDTNRAFTIQQLRQFETARREILALKARPLFHAANSAAALSLPASRYDLVRPGIAGYGLLGKGMRPVLRLISRIVFIKNVKAQTSISYGQSYRTRRPSRIATLPIGYADGVSRSLSNKADVLVQGRRCPIVGAITMDMLMIDVTGIPNVRVGAEAVLLGRQGREEITADELARRAGTISYEIVTAITSRVPRIYVGGGT